MFCEKTCGLISNVGGEAAADAEEEEQEAIAQQDDDEPLVQETMFSFEAFEIVRPPRHTGQALF